MKNMNEYLKNLNEEIQNYLKIFIILKISKDFCIC